MTQPTFKVTYLWAEEPDPGDKARTYTFTTQAELEAFNYGVSEANGWGNVRHAPEGYVVPDILTEEDHEIIANKMF